ncbi:MAG: HDIG domain-containing protein [Bacteroidales bacterium]|nr:HDIG domain-containing protein [Bacteroidales bacterium]
MSRLRPYIAFVVVAAVMLLLFPSRGQFMYKYQKGSPWIYETLISPIDFPVLKTDAEMYREKEARASEVVPCYLSDDRILTTKTDAFKRFCADNGVDQAFSGVVLNQLRELYRSGIVATLPEGARSQVLLVKQDKRLSEVPVQNVYTQQNARFMLRSGLSAQFPQAYVDSLAAAIDLDSYVIPNLIYDENTTALFHKEAVDYISPTKGTIYAGQLIVSKGELVTADIEQLLDSYKAEYERSFGLGGQTLSLFFGRLLLVVALLVTLAFAILVFERRIWREFPRLLFLLLIVLLASLSTALVSRAGAQWLFLVPYVVLLVYLDSFFNRPVSVAVYSVALLPLLMVPQYGVQLFMTNLVTGGIALLSFSHFNRGWKLFLNALILFVASGILYAAFVLISGGEGELFRKLHLALIAGNALLVVVLYPFVYLLEKIFGFVSYTRLWEMTDTNNKLLMQLSQKAPGTFQHSLQVANLAEAAVRAVDGYAMLARVGALYHDIGKMDNPLCFVENQTAGVSDDYHKELTPEASAHDIIRHVSDGVLMGQKNALPEVVIDFIRTHHGRGLMRYFYTQYCNAGGDPENKAPFTYDGLLPQTKEQAILMIADSIEAASRTLKNYNPESISALVEKIVSGKMEEHQFDEADISLREIGRVKESLKNYLLQIYHARISYPKQKKQEKAAPAKG